MKIDVVDICRKALEAKLSLVRIKKCLAADGYSPSEIVDILAMARLRMIFDPHPTQTN